MRQHKAYKENVSRPWSVVHCRRFLLALALHQTIDNGHTGRGEAEIRYPVAAFFLDSPPQADFAPSGMTGSANCDMVSKGRRDFCGAEWTGDSGKTNSESRSLDIRFVIRNSLFDIHHFPMLYASFATDNGLLTTDA